MTLEREVAQPPTRRLVGLALVLTVSSVAVVQKYFTTMGVVVYVGVVFAAALWGLRPASRWLAARVTERQALWLAAATLVLLGACFLVVYPIADAGVVGGGNDRDNGLTAATAALLHGRYPYYIRTYLDEAPDLMPGALLFAAPFVLLGNSAYQSFFWLAALLIVARWLLGDGRQALMLLWVLLALAPAFLVELMTGGDLIANPMYVLVSLLLLTRVAGAKGGGWATVALAVLLGVALSSRANFILLLPLVFTSLAQSSGWKPALGHSAIACFAFVALTLPFYLFDPAGFAPLSLQNKLSPFETILPYAGWILPALTGAISLGLAFRRVDRTGFVLLSNCALVQMFPILAGLILDMLMAGRLKLDFGVVGWGLFFLFFGVLGAWPVVALPRPEAGSASLAI